MVFSIVGLPGVIFTIDIVGFPSMIFSIAGSSGMAFSIEELSAVVSPV